MLTPRGLRESRRISGPRPTPFDRLDAGSRPESEAVVRFRKVIELELRRGCDDGAVIGGIDRFLEIARQDKGVAGMIAGAPKPGKAYRELQPRVREKWLRGRAGGEAEGLYDEDPVLRQAQDERIRKRRLGRAVARPRREACSAAGPAGRGRDGGQGRQGRDAGQAGEARRARRCATCSTCSPTATTTSPTCARSPSWCRTRSRRRWSASGAPRSCAWAAGPARRRWSATRRGRCASSGSTSPTWRTQLKTNDRIVLAGKVGAVQPAARRWRTRSGSAWTTTT